jgi:pyruvate,water dikinase
VFYGRVAGNVTAWREIGDALPGASGNDLALRMFGEPPAAPDGPASWASRLRYPVVAVKAPAAIVRAALSLRAERRRYQSWWQHSVLDRPPRDEREARAQLRLAAARYIEITARHTVVSLAGQVVAERIEDLAETAMGDRSRASDLMTGYGSVEEVALMADVHAVARGDLSLPEFVRRHGYHGPDEGRLRSAVWREDHGPVERLVEAYRSGCVP